MSIPIPLAIFLINFFLWLLEQTSSGIIKGSMMYRILFPCYSNFFVGFFLSPKSASRSPMVRFGCVSDAFSSMTECKMDSFELDVSSLLCRPFAVLSKVEED